MRPPEGLVAMVEQVLHVHEIDVWLQSVLVGTWMLYFRKTVSEPNKRLINCCNSEDIANQNTDSRGGTRIAEEPFLGLSTFSAHNSTIVVIVYSLS